jgi:hypothetical protein
MMNIFFVPWVKTQGYYVVATFPWVKTQGYYIGRRYATWKQFRKVAQRRPMWLKPKATTSVVATRLGSSFAKLRSDDRCG